MKFPGEQALDHPIDSSAHHAEVSMNSVPPYTVPWLLCKRVSGEYGVEAWDIAYMLNSTCSLGLQ